MLLASSVQAQPFSGDFSSRNPFSGDLPGLDQASGSNQPPQLIDFEPDRSSPQDAGRTIRWSAKAIDPEGDQIYYQFWLNGPSTGESWEKMTEWTRSESWRWETSEDDAGSNQVRVWIRDGNHADEDGSDASSVQDYIINSKRQETPGFVPPTQEEELYGIPAAAEEPQQASQQIPQQMPEQVQEFGRTPAQLVEANEPPSLTGFTASPYSPQTAGTAVTWTAEASDPEGDSLLFQFLLSGRTAQDWSASNTWTWDTSRVRPGDYEIEVRVIDGEHAKRQSYDDVSSTEYTITAPNQKPALVSLSPDRSSPQEAGTPITWTAQASDSDGDPLLYMFFLNGQPVTDWTGSNVWSWDTSSAPAGNYQVEARVRDGQHAGPDSLDDSRSAQFTISVPNQIPALKSLGADKASPQVAGAAITWMAEASDPENDPIRYRFFLNGQPATDWTTKNQWTWKTGTDDVGENQVEVRIIDGKHAGQDGSDDGRGASFVITAPNQKPSIVNLGADEMSPQETGTVVTWTAEASDFEGDQLYYMFLLNGQPVTDWTGSNVWIWDTASATAGSYQVEVGVRDGQHAGPDGFDDRRSASFALTAPNQKPALTEFGPDRTSPQEVGATVTWTAVAADPENDPVQYRFFLDGQAVGDWSIQNQWTWDTAGAKTGEHQVEVRIIDGKHAGQDGFDDSRSVSFVLTAPDQKPALTELVADKTSPQEVGATVTWTAQASDPENEPVQYRFFLDGQAVSEWTAQNQWKWDTAGAKAGEHQVEVRIIDGKHAGQDGFDESRSVSFVLTAPNQKPALTELVADKTSPQEVGATVTWTAQASDPENDLVQYRFFLDGQAVSDWSIQNQWTWDTAGAKTGEHQVEVRIIDGKHAGQDGFDDSRSVSFVLTAPDQKPALTELVADKTSPQEVGATVTWTAQVSDPENEPVQYQFFLDGQAVSDWSIQNQWTWDTAGAKTGEHQVEVRIIDGKHAGQDGFDDSRSVSFVLTAPDQKPALTELVADKTSPQEVGATVTWTAQAADPENEPVQYRFFLDGQAVSDWSIQNQWTWDTAGAKTGEHQVEVRIIDGKHAGQDGFDDSRSASFNIVAPAEQEAAATAPAKENETPAMVSLSPDQPGPQPIGTAVVWTAEATDPENDPLLYRFLLNGSEVTEWTAGNVWSWTASQAGTSQIEVRVRDGKHAGEDGFDSSMVAEYTINAPVQETAAETPEVETPPAPENVTEPVTPENVTAPVTPAIENVTIPENVTAPVAPSPAVEENLAPVLNLLVPDTTSPQPPGTSVTWSANATDPEGDSILYRFFLSGPATGNSWQPQTGWSAQNAWTWDTTAADTGENQVRVWIRDGKHAPEDNSDGEQIAYFSIVAPSRNITGLKYNDRNGNGVKDRDEPGLSGWTINLQKPDGSQVSTLTAEDGSYRFEGLTAGAYTVSEVLQAGWAATAPESGSQSVELGGSDLTGVEFGNRLNTYSISGMKYNDLNNNGVNDGEPGLSGWTIQLSKDGSEASTAVTGADGSYRFQGLEAGSYTITEVEQAGWTRTAPASGSHSVALKDSDATGLDFGNRGSWSISGMKYQDLDGNGARDEGEPGLSGWTVQLSKDGSVINATTTAQDGSYRFGDLAPGAYTVSEVLQDGWAQTAPASGSYGAELKDADISGLDFGNRADLSLSGVKFYDANGNGVQDEDEPGLPGLQVTLAKDGKEIATTTTGEDGSYTFTNLMPGNYEVDDPILVTVTPSGSAVVNVPAVSPHKISGVKFNDLNGNGQKDSGEQGIDHWGIVLTFVTPGPAPDLLLAQTYTDSNGAYSFANILPGTYKVSELARQGWTPTTPTEITVSVTNSNKANQNFGNRLVTPPQLASILGTKFNDLNGNGAKDAGEPGLPDWEIELKYSSNLTLAATTTTGSDGSYSFLNLTPGSYVVGEVLEDGWTQTKPAVGAGGQVYTITLAAGQNKQGMDFGNRNNNLPPIDPTLVPNKASPQKVGTPIVWTAGATDPEGDSLQYRFIVKGPSSSVVRADTGYSGSNTWSWSTVGYLPGKYNIEVWIRDGNHAGPSGYDVRKEYKNYELTSPNQRPVLKSLFADRPAPQYAGNWVKWTALASDPDGDPLQYRFFLRGPSTGGFWIDQTGWGKNNKWVWRTTGLDIGYSEVLVAVRDGKHAGASGSDDYATSSYYIISLNQPPTITSLSANLPSPQQVGVTARWMATAFDPDGDPVFFRYWLRGPSTGGLWKMVRDWSTDPTWTWPTSLADIGTSEVQVQARDGRHASLTGWDDDAGALFTVLRPNEPPRLTALNPDKPSPQYASTPVKFAAFSSDPDGDPVLYRFWLKGPSTDNAWKVVQDWSYANTWTWNSAAADSGAYTVYVYARDGKHAGVGGYDSAMGASYVLLTAPNMAPKAASLTADKPSPQYAGTSIKWTALASDQDGDPLLYRFWLKGPSTGGSWKVVQDWSSSNQWTWGNTAADAGDYTVYVYVRDGKHAGTGAYDSAVGQTFKLLDPLVARAVTTGSAIKDKPSLLFTGDGFLMAYQSWEKGTGNQGDVTMQKFDPAWSSLKNVWVASDKAYQDSPSLVFSQGYYYLAYVSGETGSRDIFLKKYDGSLNLVETKQLTSSPTNQDSPSLVAAGDSFFLAYQSWDSGSDSGGDLFITRFDQKWNPLSTVQVTDQKSYQDRPSLAYAGGNFYLAYVSKETGNLDIFLQKLDGSLNFLEKKRLTTDGSDQDYPQLKWLNGQFMLLYATKKPGNYDLVLDRFLQDWAPVDSTVVASGPGDQTASSLSYSSLDGMYWVAYASKDSQGQNIFVKPLRLALPAGLKSCDIVLTFSSTKPNRPYTLTAKFYNNYGQLADPSDVGISWSPQDAASSGARLTRVSPGTYQLTSVFGVAGDKSFRVNANIDGCISSKIVGVKVA
ncbi:MAG: hypothetical protein HPY61_05255 [Methanotrichaceae archaeon]|nr:hypothetical protein [Methanotrichaceae archaeon]